MKKKYAELFWSKIIFTSFCLKIIVRCKNILKKMETRKKRQFYEAPYINIRRTTWPLNRKKSVRRHPKPKLKNRWPMTVQILPTQRNKGIGVLVLTYAEVKKLWHIDRVIIGQNTAIYKTWRQNVRGQHS